MVLRRHVISSQIDVRGIFSLVSAELQGNQFRGIYTIILLIRAEWF
jgi:hypothetical protein